MLSECWRRTSRSETKPVLLAVSLPGDGVSVDAQQLGAWWCFRVVEGCLPGDKEHLIVAPKSVVSQMRHVWFLRRAVPCRVADAGGAKDIPAASHSVTRTSSQFGRQRTSIGFCQAPLYSLRSTRTELQCARVCVSCPVDAPTCRNRRRMDDLLMHGLWHNERSPPVWNFSRQAISSWSRRPKGKYVHRAPRTANLKTGSRPAANKCCGRAQRRFPLSRDRMKNLDLKHPDKMQLLQTQQRRVQPARTNSFCSTMRASESVPLP